MFMLRHFTHGPGSTVLLGDWYPMLLLKHNLKILLVISLEVRGVPLISPQHFRHGMGSTVLL